MYKKCVSECVGYVQPCTCVCVRRPVRARVCESVRKYDLDVSVCACVLSRMRVMFVRVRMCVCGAWRLCACGSEIWSVCVLVSVVLCEYKCECEVKVSARVGVSATMRVSLNMSVRMRVMLSQFVLYCARRWR